MNPSIKHLFSPYAIEGAHERFPNNSVDFFESSDFSIDCSSVELIEEIAKGSFGVVYHGKDSEYSYLNSYIAFVKPGLLRIVFEKEFIYDTRD
jgi:hypothetical protein